MENKHIHFIGIGGIGMSALARHYLHEGWQVSGSDSALSDLTRKLESEGAQVSYEQVAENISTEDQPALVVYTEAVKADNPELVAAKEAGIETINYFEALGRIANEYYLIAVSGTHGKSTTTAMVTDVLEEASLDPSAVVGSLRSKTGTNYRAGNSKYMVVEACEYKRDFLSLKPTVLVITNIELEHVDYYQDLADIQKAFRELASTVPEEGFIVCDTADPAVKPVIEGLAAQIVDYRQYFDPLMTLHIPGVHNRLNAAAALAVADSVGIEEEVAKKTLEHFAGIWRRFEFKGDVNGAHVYDDYSHHPTEIRAAIAGARELYPDKKLTVVFQPHTYTRTKELFAGFTKALSLADRVVLVPIYAARETNDSGVCSEQLVEALTEKGTDAVFYHTLEATALAVKESVGPEDVVLVMGAGTITQVATLLTH